MIRNKLAIAIAAGMAATTVSTADAGIRLRLDANKLFGVDHRLVSASYFPDEHKLVLQSENSREATPLVCGYADDGEIVPIAVEPSAISSGEVYLELDGKAYRLQSLQDSNGVISYQTGGSEESRVIKVRAADIDHQSNQTLVCGESGTTSLSLQFEEGGYGPFVPLGSGLSYSPGDSFAEFDLLDPFVCADFAPQAAGVGLNLFWREPQVEDASGNLRDLVYRQRSASAGLSGSSSGIKIGSGGRISVLTSDSLSCHTIGRSQSFHNFGRQEFIFRDGFGDGFNESGLMVEMDSNELDEPSGGDPLPVVAAGSTVNYRVIATSIGGMAQNVAMNSRILLCDEPNQPEGRCQTLEEALSGTGASYSDLVQWEGPGVTGGSAPPPVQVPAGQAVTLGNSTRTVYWDVSIEVPNVTALDGKELRFVAAVFSDQADADSDPSNNRSIAGFEIGSSVP